ncbi:hypothetical protein [Ralstonia solanacearum]|uniref:hypothetical protein n=1 Tax=Ralstonia solanacearum TaxID=305 RepID=UPI000E58BA31|nr:hypothetical protein [Ralstonia solanacearum]AXW24565.1 hypothetical protein CJO86_13860 [Ralstonia solanacearum]
METPFSRADWLSLVQSLVAAIAIAGAYGMVAWQNWTQRKRDSEAISERRALTLLGLQALASELARMCTLSGFQKDRNGANVIYPDIPQEFSDMAARFDRFPLERAVEVGKLEEILFLHRASRELEIIFRGDTELDGSAFVLKHRAKLLELTTRTQKIGIALCDDIERSAPGIYTDRLRRHL